MYSGFEASSHYMRHRDRERTSQVQKEKLHVFSYMWNLDLNIFLSAIIYKKLFIYMNESKGGKMKGKKQPKGQKGGNKKEVMSRRREQQALGQKMGTCLRENKNNVQ